ncbi:MAG: PKD domain-containing protein [Nitrospirae bacterium]|nr:PKD domain-containing protein [Nitrospirota bacterium]
MDEQKDPKNIPEDLEMGSSSESTPIEEAPKINNYMNDIKKPEETKPSQETQPEVNPQAEAPSEPQPEPTKPKPEPTKPEGKTIGQVKIGSAPAQPVIKPTSKKTSDPVARRKAILGCLGGFGAIALIFLILSFIFVAQTGDGESPIAQLLGVNEASFVNSLITLIHVVFILVALVTFTFTMVGLFKASMAKKDDKVAKKQGLKSALVAGIILIFILILWVFAYAYLDGKRISVAPGLTDPIITEPEETINLKAPVEIKFDASSLPVDTGKYKIIFYEWDFGDDETGTGQIISHRFEKKGKFDVILEVTLQDKKTGEELPAEYGVTVSVSDQALTATFTATPQSGEAPLKVEFDAGESVDPDGTIDTYEWDLDEDGNFDDAEGVTAEYEFDKIGRYTVALRVTSTIGDFEISEKEIVVEAVKDPEAVITVVGEPEIFISGLNYVFKGGESTAPVGEIESYEWDFNDGTPVETTKSVSHVFLNSGTYEVTLKVTDEEDNEGETSMIITIGAPQGTPKPIVITDPAMVEGLNWVEGTVPLKVTFDATGTTDSDDNIVDYEWDFDGDGEIDGYGATATYTFLNDGTYTTKLTVTDAHGNIGTETIVIKVLAKGIEAIIDADRIEGNVPLTVDFDASGSSYDDGKITSYQWDFGDGTSPKIGTASITHKYTSIGIYTAKVTVVGSDSSVETAEIIITVREIPLEACFVSVFEEGPAPLETSFDPGCATGTISSYFWDFGDGSTSTEVKPSHIYSDIGTYTASLEISDAENNISKAEVVITVTKG